MDGYRKVTAWSAPTPVAPALRLRRIVAPALLGAVLLGGGAQAQDADAAKGKILFTQRCAACHQIAAKSTPAAPGLAGVYGRPVAGLTDFAYSAGLKAKAGAWDDASLDAYLASPPKFAPGGKMFTAVPSATDRAALIAFLKTAN